MTETNRPETLLSTKTMAWLGPDGSFTRMAADQYLRERERVTLGTEVGSIRQIFESVVNGLEYFGTVPIENSTAGPVKDTHQAFTEMDDITILGEVGTPIKHFLYMSKDATPQDIREIRSKDQALEQCVDHIAQYFPQSIEKIKVDSTTLAVKQAAEDPTIAGIGSEIAAQAQGIEDKLVKFPDFEDNPNNVTTFVIIGRKGKEIQPITGRDKTTFIAKVKNQPRSLFSLLSEFADQNINLTKIKSLMSTQEDVSFLISIDGHENDEKIHPALSRIENAGIKLKRLGSYEKATYSPSQTRIKPDIKRASQMIQREVRNGNGNDHNESVVVFTLVNQPAALAKAIEPFAQRNINLTKIDSLPSGNFEEYVFYLSYDKRDEERKRSSSRTIFPLC